MPGRVLYWNCEDASSHDHQFTPTPAVLHTVHSSTGYCMVYSVPMYEYPSLIKVFVLIYVSSTTFDTLLLWCFYPTARAVGVLFSPMVSGLAGRHSGRWLGWQLGGRVIFSRKSSSGLYLRNRKLKEVDTW